MYNTRSTDEMEDLSETSVTSLSSETEDVVTMASPPKETSNKYLMQPSYRTQIGHLSGERDGVPKSVVVNLKLCKDPEFQHVLFGRLNQSQERFLHYVCFLYPVLNWLAILGYVQGYYETWVLYPMVALFCIRHTVNEHDCSHLKTPLPFVFRLSTYGLFCAGFMPLAATFGDVTYQHMRVHHVETKGVIDADDPHSRLGRMPLWRMALQCFFSPGHVGMEDVLFHYLPKNPASLWPERIAANLLHWAQLWTLYQLVEQDVFWKILFAGHVGMFILWLFFNGLIHNDDFFRVVLKLDPSGLRRTHPLVDGLFYIVSSNAWLEVKWHDVHHAMHIANCTFGTQMARGMTYSQIELACANIVDRGLFIDEVTKEPVSPLAAAGHKVGSRRAYLEAKQDAQAKKTE